MNEGRGKEEHLLRTLTNVNTKKKSCDLRNKRKEEHLLRNMLSLRESILCVYIVSVRDKEPYYKSTLRVL